MDYNLDERTVRRQITRAIARIHRQTPIYDLVDDPSMIEAVRILLNGEINEISLPDKVQPGTHGGTSGEISQR